MSDRDTNTPKSATVNNQQTSESTEAKHSSEILSPPRGRVLQDMPDSEPEPEPEPTKPSSPQPRSGQTDEPRDPGDGKEEDDKIKQEPGA